MKSLPRAFIAAAGIAVGLAQQPTTAAKSAERIDKSTVMNSNETSFVQDVLTDGRQEVELGQIALRQGSSDAVKEYAQRLVNDHNEANKKLEQIAKEYSIPDSNRRSPGSPQLARLAGEDFDHAFAQQMIGDHQKEISKFEAARKTVMNSDLRAFIDSTLPTLKEHLNQARELK